MKPSIIEKRKEPDFVRASQPLKRQCVQVSKKTNNSIYKKDARSYDILLKVARLHSTFFGIQIIDASEYMHSSFINQDQKEQIIADRNFIIELKEIVNQLTSTSPKPKKTSELCFSLITLINNQCLIIRDTIEVFCTKKIPGFKYTTIEKLIAIILINPYNDKQIILYAYSLITLRNIQSIYISYVIRDNIKALALAKIALFWGQEAFAFEILKVMEVPPVEESPGFKQVQKEIYEVLKEYKQRLPFNTKTNAELIELYNYVHEGSGIKPATSRESSYHRRDKGNTSIPKISRSFSCHDGFGLEFSTNINNEDK